MRSVALLGALWLGSLSLSAAQAQSTTSQPPPVKPKVACICDIGRPVTLKERGCSLCVAAEKQPAHVVAFSLKDISKAKPNRWLALPRVHTAGKMEMLADLTPEIRVAVWREAMARGQLLWGEHWGLAMNGVGARTQCHLHVHIGKLIDGVEWGDFTVVDDVSQIPDPGDMGVWVHPVGGKLHVHREMSAETVLMR